MALELIGLDIVFRQNAVAWGVPLGIALIPIAILVIGALLAWHYVAARRALLENAWLRLHADEVRPRPLRYCGSFVMFATVVSLLLAVWAEPERRFVVKEPVYGRVCVTTIWDISLSMKYAHDAPPFPDRLSAARQVLQDFARMTVTDPDLQGSYCRALIAFAGSAVDYVQFSTSYGEYVEAVSVIDETTVNERGTNILDAFRLYAQMVAEHAPKEKDTVFIVLLLSDGGKEERTEYDIPHIQDILAHMRNTIVYTIGFGSVGVTTALEGGHVCDGVPLERRDENGTFLGYILEYEWAPNNPVLCSDLDERLLQEIAGSPERYMHYKDKDTLLATLKQAVIEHRRVTGATEHIRFASIASWLLYPAFILAFFSFGYTRRIFRRLHVLSSAALGLVRRS